MVGADTDHRLNGTFIVYLKFCDEEKIDIRISGYQVSLAPNPETHRFTTGDSREIRFLSRGVYVRIVFPEIVVK
jgi:hypothetical protein